MYKKLFLIFGGTGREREVSFSSSRNIEKVLTENNFPYESINVDKDGNWIYKDKILNEKEWVDILKENNALVFQVIHGTYGEDGFLSELLEENNISCVGSTAEVMKLTIDKFATEKTLKENDIKTTSSFIVNVDTDLDKIEINYPAIIKPNSEGSSVALFKVKNEEELKKVLRETVPVYRTMLVQELVKGREFTCGVVDIDGITQALLPTEIILTKGETFDYEAKYTVGGSKEVTPADIDDELTKKIQDLALKVHEVCGCKDISRTDMILRDDGGIVVLEINTIPGMTKTSFIPAQLEASGYSIMDFVGGMMKKYS